MICARVLARSAYEPVREIDAGVKCVSCLRV
jgi:hypothetical protein